MTRSLLCAIALAAVDLPAGLAPGPFEVTLTAAGMADVVQTVDVPTVTFPDLAPGDYVVSACRLAATGERISTPVTASINIPAPPPEQVDVPASLTLTLA